MKKEKILVDGYDVFRFTHYGVEYFAKIHYRPFSELSGGIREFECWKIELKTFKFLWFTFSYQVRHDVGVQTIIDRHYDEIYTYVGDRLFFHAEPLYKRAVYWLESIWSAREKKKQEQEQLQQSRITNHL